MKTKILILVCLVIVSGCATTPNGVRRQRGLGAILQGLSGQVQPTINSYQIQQMR